MLSTEIYRFQHLRSVHRSHYSYGRTGFRRRDHCSDSRRSRVLLTPRHHQ